MSDPRTPIDEVARIAQRLNKLQDDVNQLKSPSGTSAYQTVAKLQGLIDDIQAQLDAYIASGTFGNTTINGTLEVNGTAHFDGQVATDALFISPAAYSTVIGATRAALWVDNTGRIGRT